MPVVGQDSHQENASGECGTNKCWFFMKGVAVREDDLAVAAQSLRSTSERVFGEGGVVAQLESGTWDAGPAQVDAELVRVLEGAHEYLLQTRRTLDALRHQTANGEQAAIVAGRAARERLPFNRKERFFTGTVLPALVTSDGFRHLGALLRLCGLEVDVEPGLEGGQDLQFFTEYSFAESVYRPEDRDRWADRPSAADTPDVVLTGPDWLLAIEAKMYDVPDRGALADQMRRQRVLVDYWARTLRLGPARVRHVLLVPGELAGTAGGLGDAVVTWERVLERYATIGPAYWVGTLKYALEAYSDLVARGSTFGANKDGTCTGLQIAQGELDDDSGRTFTWMGRDGGLNGAALADDLKTGAWRTRRYEVRYGPLPHNRNWFPISDFTQRIDQAEAGT
jgi:hypothetical protein